MNRLKITYTNWVVVFVLMLALTIPLGLGTSFKSAKASVPVDSSTCPIPLKKGTGGFRYSNDYGAGRNGGRTHKGIDLFAPSGTPIVAIESGMASQSSQNLGGKVTRLIGDSGTYYYHAHLSNWPAKLKGTSLSNAVRVERGEIIGFVGNTGNARSTPPHLHLGIKPNGFGSSKAWTNPFSYLEAWCNSDSGSPPEGTGVCAKQPFLERGDGFSSTGKSGKRGDVRQLQEQLNRIQPQLNSSVFSAALTVDGRFGGDTESAVREVQKFGLDEYGTINGKPVSIDGKVGPQTWFILCD